MRVAASEVRQVIVALMNSESLDLESTRDSLFIFGVNFFVLYCSKNEIESSIR